MNQAAYHPDSAATEKNLKGHRKEKHSKGTKRSHKHNRIVSGEVPSFGGEKYLLGRLPPLSLGRERA